MRKPARWFMLTAAAAFTLGCSDEPTGPSNGDTGDTQEDTDAPGTDETSPDAEDPDAADPDTDSPETDTPEGDDTDTPPVDDTALVVINEIAAKGQPEDWIELFNASSDAIDIGGWSLIDDDHSHTFYFFEEGTYLDAGAYLLLFQDPTGVDGFEFGLGQADEVSLFNSHGELVDHTAWQSGDSPDAASWGRFPNGTGDFKTLANPTPGAENIDNTDLCNDGEIQELERCDGTNFGGLSCEALGWAGGELVCSSDCLAIIEDGCEPREPALVINEVTSQNDDDIELFNGTDSAIDLSGYSVGSESSEETYVFEAGTVLDAGAYLVVAKPVHGFGIKSADTVTLWDDQGAIVDEISWSKDQAKPSFARIPNGVGGFLTSDLPTFGNENIGERDSD